MALDAAFLSLICRELNERAAGAKVDKVYQPERDEFVFVLRTYGNSMRLRVSASSSTPAVYITAHTKDNPKQAPTLCMLARKLFIGGRFISAEQPDAERVITLRFECTDEMGDTVERRVIAEIMGRSSNVLFTDANGRITEAVKHAGADPDAARVIIAGMPYVMPPAQNKTNPRSVTEADVFAMLRASDESLSDALLHSLAGFSPIVCRELAYRASGDVDAPAEQADAERVFAELKKLLAELDAGGTPAVVCRGDGSTVDFSFFAPTLYGDAMEIKRFDSPSELLDFFYYERDRAERIKQRTAELSRLVSRNIERAVRKAAAQSRELAECENADELRIRGELINAYIHEIEPGSSVAVVKNYYDNYNEIHIPLDSTLSPQRNAQKYFREYRKSDTRKKKLAEQLRLGEDEIEWLRSVAAELSLAESEDDIARVREELAAEGYIRAAAPKNPKKQSDKKKEYTFECVTTSDGFKVYYGKNNLQNDALTMRFASNSDIWFHVREGFGAHVVLRLEGREPTETAIYEAARVAASRSKSAEGTKISVDYTEIRNVRKPKGSKPGKVLYVNFKTIIV
ncbi:MAG: NFACT family protein [Clostridia bacterium]|nr:NFACT family protein [Clostridia bacterium]